MEIYKWENKTRQTNMGWEKNKQRQPKNTNGWGHKRMFSLIFREKGDALY